MGRVKETFWEFGGNAKASNTSVHTADLNAGNITAQLALAATFQASIEAISTGNPGTVEIVATTDEVAKTPSSEPVAQRENKWLISFTDDVTGLGGSFTVPCYTPSLLGADGEFMDSGAAEYTALVAATEAYVKSNTGNAVTVTSVRFSARNI